MTNAQAIAILKNHGWIIHSIERQGRAIVAQTKDMTEPGYFEPKDLLREILANVAS